MHDIFFNLADQTILKFGPLPISAFPTHSIA